MLTDPSKSRDMPRASSSYEVPERRSSRELTGLGSFEAQVEHLKPSGGLEQKLTPKDDEHSGESSVGTVPSARQLVAMALRLGAELDEDFVDGLMLDDEEVDATPVVKLVAPVVAAFLKLNPTWQPRYYLGRRIASDAPTSADDVVTTILEQDVDAALTVPDAFPKAQRLQAERREEQLERQRQAVKRFEAQRRQWVADELLVELEDGPSAWVEDVVAVIDAYRQANSRILDVARTYRDLAERVAELGAKSRPHISALMLGLHPEATVPESVDPDGARVQQLQRLKEEEDRRRREEENDLVEDKRAKAQESLRDDRQRERSAMLVKGAQSLHGELRWCASGFEGGKLSATDLEWYRDHGVTPPSDKVGRGDPRGRQVMKSSDEVVDNAFTRWIRCDRAYDPSYSGKPAPEPSFGSFMNCWEGVIFAAFKAGLIGKEGIIEMYKHCRAQKDPDSALMNLLGYGISAEAKPGRREPREGDILFYGHNEHVAIYKGQGKVLQLWHDGRASNLYTSIKKKDDHRESDWSELEIGHEIRFAPNPF
ncbi:MAG: hypothetical protein U1F43_29280 [Myxococcota bacterium]